MLVTSAGEPATAQQLTCILVKLNELEAISSIMAKLVMVKNYHLIIRIFFNISCETSSAIWSHSDNVYLLLDINNIAYSNIFCHFKLCHNRKNNFTGLNWWLLLLNKPSELSKVRGARGRARDAVEFQSSFSSHSINKEKPNIQGRITISKAVEGLGTI